MRKSRIASLLAVQSLILVGLVLVGSKPADAEIGTNLAQFDASVTAGVPHCNVGTGLAFDGDSLILTCWGSNTLWLVDAVTHQSNGVKTITGAQDLGALAWDASRGRLWACSSGLAVIAIDLNASAVDHSLGSFATPGCIDGLAYDGADDTFWVSPDAFSTTYHYSITGSLLASFSNSGKIGGCGNSGIAVGGDKLYLANNGCSEIYEVSKDFGSSRRIAHFPRRLEDLECDGSTFAPKGAIWSLDAYDRTLNAWEIPAGLCEGGGGLFNSYVALGDSVAAGEGLPYGWFWEKRDWDFDGWTRRMDGGEHVGHHVPYYDCHRAPRFPGGAVVGDEEDRPGAYPVRVAEKLGVTSFKHLACTGSTVARFDPIPFAHWDFPDDCLISSGHSGDGVLHERRFDKCEDKIGKNPTYSIEARLPQQLGVTGTAGSSAPNPEYDAAQADLVSLTVGANDLTFAGVMLWCYVPGLYKDCGSSSVPKGIPFDDETLEKRLSAYENSLRQTLNEIVDRGRAATVPKVPVVALTTYYDPFPQKYKQCRDIKLPGLIRGNVKGLGVIHSGEVEWVRKWIRKLNATIRSVAGEFHNAIVVGLDDLTDNGGDHRWCSADPWIYGPSILTEDAAEEADTNPASLAPFHPTGAAAEEIANRIVNALQGHSFTRAGADVVVSREGLLKAIFERVLVAGQTTIRRLVEKSGQWNSCPLADSLRIYACYDVATSSVWTGSTRLEIPYSGPATIWHYADGAWHPLSTTYENGVLKAATIGLSPFAVADQVSAVHAAFETSGALMSPATVSFDATASRVENGGPVTSYEWDFGDGVTITTAEPLVHHVFESAGTYRVSLVTTSAAKARDEAVAFISVENAPPEARWDAPARLGRGMSFTFDGTASFDPNGAITDIEWHFGDGSDPQIGGVVEHAFAEPGYFDVTLAVYDNEGLAGTITRTIEILPDVQPPRVNISKPVGVYLDDVRIFDPPAGQSMTIGPITLEATATDELSGIQAFQFEIDGMPVDPKRVAFDSATSTYRYRWEPDRLGFHEITARAVDRSGNPGRHSINVLVLRR